MDGKFPKGDVKGRRILVEPIWQDSCGRQAKGLHAEVGKEDVIGFGGWGSLSKQNWQESCCNQAVKAQHRWGPEPRPG